MEEQLAIARRAYALLGCEDRLESAFYEGGHRWYGGRTVSFLEASL
ncbi:hypothetical protein OMP38_15780 [Cohnella ginsengisoli]|uniref:Uncharacterized protein n=1 Tax=Cohnella ginsengisoli TaxID=425004 RepID=A0A9X4KHP0_9BACL|nr:hypothetical protein [Cohnella ginsengisoli]MDG0792161.1 hypothetical protein [Cohnella ginsengisoli]